VDCTAAPLSPTNLVAQSPDVHTADLQWTDTSLVEDGYEVQRWDEVSNQWGTIGDLPANTESYRDASLASDLTYWYLVRAKKDGGYSYFSNYATVNTATRPPEAPSEVKATSYYHYYAAVAASWKDNSENEQGFRVERAPDHAGPWQTVATVGTNQEYFGEYVYDTDVTAGQQVCYRITAFNGKGEASSSDCATPPAAPTDLVATTVDHQSIDISWSFASNADSFVVFRYGYPYGEFLGNVTVAATEGTYRDAGLNGSTSYWYWLVAVNDNGYSDAPNAFATTDPDPSTAPNLTLAPGSSGSQPGAMSRLLDKGPSRRAEPPSATRVPLCPSGVPPRHECPRMTIPPRAVR
jgi:hypothetical protein